MASLLQEKELMELVKKAAEESLDLDLSDAKAQTPLRSLGIDSLDQLELITVLEECLDIGIPDGRLAELDTVGSLIVVLMELQEEQQVTDASR